jgi:uncharacterized protein YbaP (TraB family)
MTVPGRIAALSFVALLATIAPAASAQGPALWMVRSATAKVYLFGTMHALKAQTAWSTPAIDSALGESDDLYLEVADDLSDPAAIMPALTALGMDAAHPLSTKISKADLDLLDARLKQAGLPGEAPFEAFRPWVAAVLIAATSAQKAGYTQKTGVEMTLRERANAAGKPIKGMETVEQQLHALSDLPLQDEVLLLHQSLAQPVSDDDANAKTFDKMGAMWQAGDVAGAAKIEQTLEAQDPALATALVTKRNTAWAALLDKRLHATGTSFVAVGFLHLTGAGSVIDDLTKMGYTVERVE